MTDRLTWREAREDDVPAFVALVESAYRGDGSRAGWTTEADLLGGQRMDLEMGRELLATPGTLVLLFWKGEGADALTVGGQAGGDSIPPVACVQLEDKGDGVAYFGTFAVAPQMQGSGIGKLVMLAAEQAVTERWGATTMRMTVIRQRAELISFYERRGFALTGESEPFPYGQEQFGLPQRDDLEFVVLEKQLQPQTATPGSTA